MCVCAYGSAVIGGWVLRVAHFWKPTAHHNIVPYSKEFFSFSTVSQYGELPIPPYMVNKRAAWASFGGRWP